jgi:hypothetical protein
MAVVMAQRRPVSLLPMAVVVVMAQRWPVSLLLVVVVIHQWA